MGLNCHQRCFSFVFDRAKNSLTCSVVCHNYCNALLSDYSRSRKTSFGDVMVRYVQAAIDFWSVFPFQMALYQIHWVPKMDGWKNCNQKKTKEVPYVCAAVNQQQICWVYKRNNLIFSSSSSVSTLIVNWALDLPNITIANKENCLKWHHLAVFFPLPIKLLWEPPVFSQNHKLQSLRTDPQMSFCPTPLHWAGSPLTGSDYPGPHWIWP